LDTLITVEKPVTTNDATYGTEVVTWEALSYEPGSPAVVERYWASVQDMIPTRGEGVQNEVVINRNLTKIRIRWRDDVTTDMRITVHRDVDTIYQIISGPSDVDGRKRLIELICERYSS